MAMHFCHYSSLTLERTFLDKDSFPNHGIPQDAVLAEVLCCSLVLWILKELSSKYLYVGSFLTEDAISLHEVLGIP